jgi:hypothetical protein
MSLARVDAGTHTATRRQRISSAGHGIVADRGRRKVLRPGTVPEALLGPAYAITSHPLAVFPEAESDLTKKRLARLCGFA